MFQTSTLAL